jgi:hypothetical protein
MVLRGPHGQEVTIICVIQCEKDKTLVLSKLTVVLLIPHDSDWESLLQQIKFSYFLTNYNSVSKVTLFSSLLMPLPKLCSTYSSHLI